ncbi:MAG: hypothetical protein ACREHD_05880 [Pirellulales bacterium]
MMFASFKEVWIDPQVWRRDLWWSVVWLTWGTLCATAIGLGDQSFWAGIVWLTGSSVIAVFGQPLWGLYGMVVCHISAQLPWPSRRDGGSVGLKSDSSSFLTWLEDEQLSILDPNRKWWEVYLPTIFTVAPVHGIWAGSIVGCAAVILDDWRMSALHGTLLGCLGGIVAIILIYGMGMALFITSRHGPYPATHRAGNRHVEGANQRSPATHCELLLTPTAIRRLASD